MCAGRAPRGNGYYCPEQVAQERTILGAAQRDWLLEGLSAQTSGWNVLANQVGFAPQDDAERLDRWRFFVDPWDGYVADRQRVLTHLKDNKLYNTVVITGDKHQNSVRNVPESYLHIDGPAIATEFVGTSISSGSDDPRRFTPTHGGDPNNPHILLDDYHRGYVRVELTRDTWRSDFRVVDTVRNPDTKNVSAWTLESWIVENGEPRGDPAERRTCGGGLSEAPARPGPAGIHRLDAHV